MGGRTSGTRPKGNGAGWGGAAKGAGAPPGSGQGGRPAGVKNGEGKQARARAALEEAAPLAVQTIIEIAGNVEDPRALQAAQAVLNRVGLHEKAETTVNVNDVSKLSDQELEDELARLERAAALAAQGTSAPADTGQPTRVVN